MGKDGKNKAEGRGGLKQKSSVCTAVMTAIYNAYMFIRPNYTSRRWEKCGGDIYIKRLIDHSTHLPKVGVQKPPTPKANLQNELQSLSTFQEDVPLCLKKGHKSFTPPSCPKY